MFVVQLVITSIIFLGLLMSNVLSVVLLAFFIFGGRSIINKHEKFTLRSKIIYFFRWTLKPSRSWLLYCLIGNFRFNFRNFSAASLPDFIIDESVDFWWGNLCILCIFVVLIVAHKHIHLHVTVSGSLQIPHR